MKDEALKIFADLSRSDGAIACCRLLIFLKRHFRRFDGLVILNPARASVRWKILSGINRWRFKFTGVIIVFEGTLEFSGLNDSVALHQAVELIDNIDHFLNVAIDLPILPSNKCTHQSLLRNSKHRHIFRPVHLFKFGLLIHFPFLLPPKLRGCLEALLHRWLESLVVVWIVCFDSLLAQMIPDLLLGCCE